MRFLIKLNDDFIDIIITPRKLNGNIGLINFFELLHLLLKQWINRNIHSKHQKTLKIGLRYQLNCDKNIKLKIVKQIQL